MTKSKPDFLIITLCLLFVFVPLVYMHDIFLFTRLPKRFVLSLGVAFATIGYWLRIRNTQTLAWPSGPAMTFLVGLMSIVTLSLWQSTYPLDSLVEFAYQIALIGLFFIVASALTSRDLPALLQTNTIMGLIIGVIGILQYHNLAFGQIPSTGHPAATFGYRNFAAMYLVCILPLSGLAFCYSKSRIHIIIALLSTSCITTFLIYTRTRGAWAGILVGSFITAAFLIHRDLRTTWWQTVSSTFTKEKWFALFGAVVIIVVLSTLPPRFVDTGLQRFDEKKADITATMTSAFEEGGDRGRFQMWLNTLELIKNHPILGVGPGSWKRMYPPYDQGVMIRLNSSPSRPHNDYLWLAAEHGILGLLCYLGFLAIVFHSLYQSRYSNDPLRIASAPFFAIALIAIHSHAFFSFPKEQPQATIFIYFLCGIIVGTGRRILSRRLNRILLILITLQALSTTALYYAYIRFDRHYLYALVAEDNNDWTTVEEEIRAGLKYGSFRSHAWIIAGRAAEKHGRYVEAENAYRQAMDLSPHVWYAHNGLGIALKRQERYAEAEEQYLEALRYFPGPNNGHRADILTNLGALYKSMGNLAQAEDIYRQVLEIQPQNAGANNNLANFYKARGQLDSALVAYQIALKNDSTQVQAHFNISDLYIKKGQPQDALFHAEIAAQLDPANPRIFWNLGQVLERNQRFGDAEKAYLQALTQDPQYAQAYFNLGNLLFEQQAYARAKLSFQAFLELWKEESDIRKFAQTRLNQCNQNLAPKK